ncbi:MAG: hypothetical protein ACP5KB_00815 [Thermoprotei archaeon]
MRYLSPRRARVEDIIRDIRTRVIKEKKLVVVRVSISSISHILRFRRKRGSFLVGRY